MKYLVTGGAGFIGSSIVSTLVDQGKYVRVADNFSTGRRHNLDMVRDSIEIIEGDLAELDYARKVVDGVDYVIHQAAIPSVPRSVDDPIGNNQSGVIATLNLLVAARDAGVLRMTYASSSSIYGEARDKGAKTEGMLPAPLSPYGVSKLAAEQYCMAFYTVYGFEVVALRYFNVFGPRQDPESEYAAVIPRFITALLQGNAPKIYGDGEQTRDFTYVGNIVNANIHALNHAEAPGQIFNIAMGTGSSLNSLVKTLHQLTGITIDADYTDARSGDIRHSYADVSKALNVLQFESEVSVVDGLRSTIDWYRRFNSNQNSK
ncbi:MAG: LPS biosynthesis protein WbpP [Anaerolineaceae bacterium]|mgnify:CR=1 FL=1|nr:LPS biosynthesis protein WbpP [Anaerolineaceae bacterium]